MPDMNGLAVAKEMRQLCTELPIRSISAHSSLAANACATIQRTTVVPKPYLLTTLAHHANARLPKPSL